MTKPDLNAVPRFRPNFLHTRARKTEVSHSQRRVNKTRQRNLNAMPGPSNTLLIEGSFSELAEELAQYIDNLSKTEAGAGVQSEIESSIAKIREAEAPQETETADATQGQKDKDDVLKKIVTKATVLNSAPERGS